MKIKSVLVLALLMTTQVSVASVKWVFPVSPGSDNSLLISKDLGQELNRILNSVPSYILVNIQSISADFRSASGDPRNQPTPHYWIRATAQEIGLNMAYEEIFSSLYSVGTTHTGDFFVRGGERGSLAAAIERGLRSTTSSRIRCETREVGASRPYPGFSSTVCVFFQR